MSLSALGLLFLVLRFACLWSFSFRHFFLDAPCISLLVRSPSAVWFSMFYVSICFFALLWFFVLATCLRLRFVGSFFWTLHAFLYWFALCRLFLHVLCLCQVFFSLFWFFVLGACLRLRFVGSFFWTLHAFLSRFGLRQPFVFPCSMSLSTFFPFLVLRFGCLSSFSLCRFFLFL
jgi:hypothetical protein